MGFELGDFKNDDDFNISAYFESVATAIKGADAWEVQADEITLGFFSCAKFLMFRDLDLKSWPPPGHLLKRQIGGGFERAAVAGAMLEMTS